MRSNASLCLPILLLLAGCGGVGLGNIGDDPQLPAPPARAAEAAHASTPSLGASPVEPVFAPTSSARPGASYAPPSANAAAEAPSPQAQDLPDEANSYRTADGKVHMLPRGRRATAQPEPVSQNAPEPAPRPPVAVAEAGPPPTEGPQGTSGQASVEERYDAVGHAGVRGVAGDNSATANAIVAVHPTLAAGTVVEVTSLDTAHTVLVLVTATMSVPPGHVIDLSTGAARLLGGEPGGTLAVRVRKVVATPQDQNLLRSGQAASDRIDAPAPLVAALRRRLATPVAAAPVAPNPVALPPSRAISTGPGATYPAPARAARAVPQARSASGSYYLQVAALSASDRAQALARSLGGSVRPGGNLYKVQVGPYASTGDAERAKSQFAARGYGGAVILRLP